jgi:hypothetical protein
MPIKCGIGAGKYKAREVWSYSASEPSCESGKADKDTGNILESPVKTADY